jgi:hypothetical protein
MLDYLRAKNPAIEIYVYRLVTEYPDYGGGYNTFEGTTVPAKIAALYSGEDWFLRRADGSNVTAGFGNCLNYSDHVGQDGSSRRLNQWLPDFWEFLDARAAHAGKITGYFLDNTKYYPTTATGDWNNDGSGNDGVYSAAMKAAAKAGHTALINRIRANSGTSAYKLIGNSESEDAQIDDFNNAIGESMAVFRAMLLMKARERFGQGGFIHRTDIEGNA